MRHFHFGVEPVGIIVCRLQGELVEIDRSKLVNLYVESSKLLWMDDPSQIERTNEHCKAPRVVGALV